MVEGLGHLIQFILELLPVPKPYEESITSRVLGRPIEEVRLLVEAAFEDPNYVTGLQAHGVVDAGVF